MYADIIVDIIHEKLDRTFQYRVPESLAGKAVPGSIVRIPFGRGSKERTGYVIGLSEDPKIDPERIRDILSVDENKFDLQSRMISLAAWMKKRYGSTMAQALNTMLPVRDKQAEKREENLILAVTKPEAEKWLDLFTRKNQKNRARLLSALLEKNEIPKPTAHKDYKTTPDTLRYLQDAGIIRIETSRTFRLPTEFASLKRQGILSEGEEEAELTPEQKICVDEILNEWEQNDRPSLIMGVTGSGKTHVYMELMQKTLDQGRQVIYMIPEISLSWQSVHRMWKRFGDRLTLIHSRMSAGERFDSFERMRSGEASIVIGPRSALFAPFPKLGLIIIDEEQESSYKSEQTPRYDARETAVKRAELEGAHLVMGSATPSVDSFYAAGRGDYAFFSLEKRYNGASLPEVSLVDMRKELEAGNRSIFSRELAHDIEDRLEKKEQTMLFLNRRGFSGFVSCRSCGKAIKCPHCDITLTLHRNGKLICHYCGYEKDMVDRCPSCGSPYIKGFQTGTEQVENMLRERFPKARVLRMDKDTTGRKGEFSDILNRFASHQADILVGTQMIVKGHDFPDVTLVGALAADLSLFSGSFKAAERTYQLLVQAEGRAGRGKRPGKAVIQTYNPENYSIQAAAHHDYKSFYREEIEGRELMGYPPASGMITVHASCTNQKRLEAAMQAVRNFLIRYGGENVRVLGPVTAAITKIKDSYQEVMYIKGREGEKLIALREYLEKYIEINKGFDQVYFQYDWNDA
ncbi:MAG: primosomal protein N' [Eubacterium sp.]|nr:primosomal protein N' [Eubacterium sp.]